nr:MAG TPA: hypothetical protein [Caudoviricetes sp.]
MACRSGCFSKAGFFAGLNTTERLQAALTSPAGLGD